PPKERDDAVVPTGAVLVNARSGATKQLDRDATGVWPTSTVVLARRDNGPIRAFAFDGSPRFTIDQPGVDSAISPLYDNGRFLYVPPDDGPRVYDLTSGTLLGRGASDIDTILSPADRNAAWSCS